MYTLIICRTKVQKGAYTWYLPPLPASGCKVVCHGLGNLISCLDDIIAMLRSGWPTSERAVSRAGWPVYEVRFTSVGMY